MTSPSGIAPPSRAYGAALDEFVRLDVSPDDWDTPAFERVLEGFRTRFAATKTEEGTVMATMLAYVIQGQRTSGQAGILAEFRTSEEIRQLFERAREERESFLASAPAATVE